MPSYTGDAFKDFVLAIIGNLLVAGLAVGVATQWAKSEWGKMIGFILGAAVVGVFVWNPNGGMDFLKAISSSFFGAASTTP